MTDDIYTYFVRLPEGIDELVLPCFGGYTIYIGTHLSDQGRIRAYNHAMHHINNLDFEKADVQEIEYEAHRKEESDD